MLSAASIRARLIAAWLALLGAAEAAPHDPRPDEPAFHGFPHALVSYDFSDPGSRAARAQVDGGRLERAELRAEPRGVVLRPDSEDAARQAVFELAPYSVSRPFREVLLSWNVETPPGAGFRVEARIARAAGDWSPWLAVGEWGTVPKETRVEAFDGGRVDVDHLRLAEPHERVQVRLRGFRAESAAGARLRVERVSICVSDLADLIRTPADPCFGTEAPRGRLDVPFRSQTAEDPEIASRICSPTSLAMVLAFRGIDRPTAEVAARAFDPVHDLYGNWPRNVQAAFSYGVPGYVTRFSRWHQVSEMLRGGQPLIFSIRADEGELRGAPYPSTKGHLLVLTGYDGEGGCFVNDPAATGTTEGATTYRLADLERVWLAKGGVAYVLLPPRK